MKLPSVPVGIAAVLAALAAGLVAEVRGSVDPATGRHLTLNATREARPTRRSDSLRRRLDAAAFSRRFAGANIYPVSDDVAASEAPAASSAPRAVATASVRAPVPPSTASAGGPAAAAHVITASRAPASPPPSRSLAPAPAVPAAPPSLADTGGHTAIYDIRAHTIYLPNGDKLEAHSGIGHRLDNPRYVDQKNRGPTPPNVYELALREHRFHGVRALRLIPVGDGRMFGRDGILAHTYMLGPNGQSNGCVAVRDYPALLHAYLSGEVDRLVVVDHLATHNPRIASLR